MKQPKITIPTYFTLLRFVLVPIFIHLFLEKRFLAATLVLSAAGLTDFLDGFIARRFHMRSRLGSFLDPMADKFLMVMSFLFLSIHGHLPWAVTWLVIGRDIGISMSVIALNLMRIKLYYRPTYFSKLTTTSQIIVLILAFLQVLLANRPMGFLPANSLAAVGKVQEVCIVIAVALTVFSAIQYAYIGYKFYRFGERKSA